MDRTNLNINKELLNSYKAFNYKSSLIKILVGYIKPSFLFKSEILTPIHLGASIAKAKSKDGVISDDDLIWLKTNCEADNNGKDNISYLNRRIGFLTGTYWAYRNYKKKLGNPEYFGSFGYRRLLDPCFLKDFENYDMVLPKKTVFEKETLKEQFIKAHGKILFEAMLKVFESCFKNKISAFLEYLNLKEGYFFEIYVLKRELFFEMFNFIYCYTLAFLEKYPQNLTYLKDKRFKQKQLLQSFLGKNYLENFESEKRDLAFILERLTGFYLWRLTKNKLLNYKEVSVINTEIADNPKSFLIKEKVFEKMRTNFILKTKVN